MPSFTRRRRLLLVTAGCAAVFLGAAGFAATRWNRRADTYKPVGPVDGLTSELARTLPTDYPRVTFVDVSKQAGIDFHHFFGSRSSQLPEDMGSGAAWGDYDND